MTTVTTLVDPADPVFDGHYPGFPILPGLFLLERVQTLVRPPGARLVALERAKFTRPVRPGAWLTVAAEFTGPVCTVAVSTADGPIADFRLRYDGGAA